MGQFANDNFSETRTAQGVFGVLSAVPRRDTFFI
jgi:hypothetical protein